MSEALIQLKAGTESQPLFLAHGMGGSVDEFRDLVKFIQTERSICGLQARGNDGVEKPFDRIEDSAQYFLDAIKKAQPAGPYFLLGYSLGGLVALEMAQQLASQGQTIGLLAMLESYPHPTQLALGQRIRLALRMKRRALRAVPDPSKPRLSASVRNTDFGLEGRSHTLPVTERAYKSAYNEWTHYQPRFYEGKIHFVRAAISTIYPDDPIAVWSRLARELEVVTVPGDHHGILAEHYEILGSMLSGYLRDADPTRTP
jgi:aspartate racemase